MIGDAALRARVFGAPAARILRPPATSRSTVSPLLRRPHSSRPIFDVASSVRWAQNTPARRQNATLFQHAAVAAQRESIPALLRASRLSRAFSTKLNDNNNQSTSTKQAPPSNNLPNSPEPKHKSLYDRLPHIPKYHRPTKEELLATATGWISRLNIRFKWFSIRSVRPFSLDELFGIFSWVLLGHLLWIVLGTTTFVSLVILVFNTVSAQEVLARWVGSYLTQSSGVKVTFESAIVPQWRSGVITFRNVFVSKRPGSKARVSKGSPETAAAAAAAVDRTSPLEEDNNFTQYDLKIDEINVTLSFRKWFNAEGLLSDVSIRGVRGIIDRTNVHSTGEELDRASYRHTHSPGDFEIDSFKLTDALVEMRQPGGFRPFWIAVFSADLPRLRRQWIFHDFICGSSVSGSYDESLFTIHPRQLDRPASTSEAESVWTKETRIRIDSLKIDHLNKGVTGPFSWIHEGTVSLVADVKFPAENGDGLIAKWLSDMKDSQSTHGQNGLAETIEAFLKAPPSSKSTDSRLLAMDMRINFNDVRASVPLLTRDLTYVNNALIRPIVGYINSRKTFIPINCQVVKRLSDFDGSYNLWDSGLLEDVSMETYNAIVYNIYDSSAQIRRFKKVGLWSLQLAVQAIFAGMAGLLI